MAMAIVLTVSERAKGVFQFTDRDTQTFQFCRGDRDDAGQFKTVHADPAKLRRQLDIAIPNRNQLIHQHLACLAITGAKEGDFTPDELVVIRTGLAAHESLCLGVRAAFGLLPFDEATGHGCTDSMVVGIFNAYSAWLESN